MLTLYLLHFGSLMYLPLFCAADGFCIQIHTLHFCISSHNFDTTSESSWEASEFNTIKMKDENHFSLFFRNEIDTMKKNKNDVFPFENPSKEKCCDSNLFLALINFCYLCLISFIIIGDKKKQNKKILHHIKNKFNTHLKNSFGQILTFNDFRKSTSTPLSHFPRPLT